MTERKTLAQLAEESNVAQPKSIAGRPADVCPYCGAAMFVGATNTLDTTIERHVYCRNSNCGKGFISRQPPAVIIREVNRHVKIPSDGKHSLTVHKDSA